MNGVFGGSQYNILGPAGALINIINMLKLKQGLYIMPFVAMVAGIFCAACTLTTQNNYLV